MFLASCYLCQYTFIHQKLLIKAKQGQNQLGLRQNIGSQISPNCFKLITHYETYNSEIIIIMGCNVVSVYNDEVIGKIGYPQLVLDDLSTRDYRPPFPLLKPREYEQKIQTIYGYTQSFTTSRLFVMQLKNKQYVVYTAGRFIVIHQPSSSRKTLIANQEYISSFMVDQKWCIVALNGGTLLLWDLQFLQIKLQILLPENSQSVSSVGLSQKYIFVTDSSRPHNIAYIYDIRTGRMLAHGIIPTFEPVLRSISVGQNLHVTAAADGVWFMKLIKQEKQMQIVRGMFGYFPKTSMLCVANFGNYIVSGGVDGYVYIWLASSYQCMKAIKVADYQITALGVKNKQIIVGSSQGRIKAYTFEVLKKKKVQVGPPGLQEELNEEVSFIMIDSYVEGGQAISLCGSQAETYLYYCFTREGLFFKKWLPAQSSEKKLVNPELLNNTYLSKLAAKSKIGIAGNVIYSIYCKEKDSLNVDIIAIEGSTMKLKQERQLALKQTISSEQEIDFNPSTNQICYITKDKNVRVGISYEKGVQSPKQENIVVIGDFQNEKILAINFVLSKINLICVTTNQTVAVFQRNGQLKYEEKCYLKHENKLPESLKVDDLELIFQEEAKQWKIKGQTWKSYDSAEIERLKTLHSGEVSSRDSRWKQKKISCVQGFAILWRN